MRHRFRAGAALSLVLAVFVGALLAACAQPSQPGGSVSSDPTASSPPLTPSTVQPTLSSTVTGSKGAGQMTIRGQVEQGVEAGCMILKAEDGKTYLLLGGDRALITGGGTLEAVGELQPGLMTTCQQGTPFAVSQLRKL